MFKVIFSTKKSNLFKLMLLGGLALTSMTATSFAGKDGPSARASLGGDELDDFLEHCVHTLRTPQERRPGEVPSLYTVPQETLIPLARRLMAIIDQHPTPSPQVTELRQYIGRMVEMGAVRLNFLWEVCLKYDKAIRVPDAERDYLEKKRTPKDFRLPDTDIPASLITRTGWRASTLLLLNEMDSGMDGRSHPGIFGPAFIPLFGAEEVDSFERLKASLYNIFFIRLPGKALEAEGRITSSWGVATYDLDSRRADDRFLSLRTYIVDMAKSFTESDAFVRAYAPIARERHNLLRDTLEEIVDGIKAYQSRDPQTYFKLLLGLEAMLYFHKTPELSSTLWEKRELADVLSELLTFDDNEDLDEIRQDAEFFQADPETGISPRTDAEIIKWFYEINPWMKDDKELKTKLYRDPYFIRITAKKPGSRSDSYIPTLVAHRHTVIAARNKLARAGVPISQPDLTREGVLRGLEQTREAMDKVCRDARDYTLRFIEQTSSEQPESLKTRFERRMAELNEQEVELKKRFTPRAEAASASATAAAL